MKIAILGTVGVPARYGGFETLADNLVHEAQANLSCDGTGNDLLTVYCSARPYSDHPPQYESAQLRYSRLAANGYQSVFYDLLTSLDAVVRGHDTLLILGVSGAVAIPFLRMVSRARIIINIDGIEWRRDKWRGMARHWLCWSEALAVRYAHAVIADNEGIAVYLRETYGVEANVIAYGGDHALAAKSETPVLHHRLPADYALALCRIEPENNIKMILEAFEGSERPLVFVGNWDNSDYGRELKARFQERTGYFLLNPVYQPGPLYHIRSGATVYVHGHSAGGTNPSLVEMMHFGVPVLAYDCNFNRYTTDNRAAYFDSTEALRALLTTRPIPDNGAVMKVIAQQRYTWDEIGRRYFELMRSLHDEKCRK